MGTLYTVLPLTDDLRSWLDQAGAGQIPSIGTTSRFPTIRELKAALTNVEDCTIQIEKAMKNLHVTITSTRHEKDQEWASLIVTGVDEDIEDEEAPHEFYFETGSYDLIVRVLERIVNITGPLILVADTGPTPVVIS